MSAGADPRRAASHGRAGIAALLCALAVGGCAVGEALDPETLTGATQPPRPTGAAAGPVPVLVPPVPPGEPDLTAVDVALEPLVTLAAPTFLTTRFGDPALYVTERAGTVRRIVDGVAEREPYLDISDETTTDGERGLFSIAFSPDGERLYVSFTDARGDAQIDEVDLDDGAVDLAQRRTVLRQDQPFSNHNGGQIAFGPDGYLYIGLGDGGGSNDPSGNGQNPGTLLGKLLRIDPVARPDAPYGIPQDNPYVGQAGARPEVFAIGLRNPWRFSFDRTTADLWIGDVGQDALEEIDFMPSTEGVGANYGWSGWEGTYRRGEDAAQDAVAPISEYAHDRGRCAIAGGYVYRGAAIPELQGAYLYTDLCDGRIRALVARGGRAVATADLGLTVERAVSFGEDADGELYVLSISGDVVRLVPGSG